LIHQKTIIVIGVYGSRKYFLDICQHMGWTVVEQLDKDDKLGNGFLVLIQKMSSRMDKC